MNSTGGGNTLLAPCSDGRVAKDRFPNRLLAPRRPFLLPAIGPAGTLDTGEQVSQARTSCGPQLKDSRVLNLA